MNIEQLQIFQTVAQCQNFSAAATKLGISQSAVSRAIAALEDELGIVLLARGRFGARITAIGEQMLEHARQILRTRELMEREANVVRGLGGGRVRIASFRSAATHLIPPLLAKLTQKFPNIEVRLTESAPLEVEQGLREGVADIGLLPLPRTPEFETWEIARDEFVVLLPEGTRSESGQLTWNELSAYSFILYNNAECTSLVIEHWAKEGQKLDVAYEIKEDSTIVSMVSQGLGATVLPRLAALPIPPGVEVCQLPVPLERSIGAAVLANADHPPAVFAFIDLLKGTGVFRDCSA
ncbi:LysR family transcriptional regulator [Synechococcus sp. PCC 7336]|uniref:LysR family transcriptional regulator n=1 Tax=Synechococcus sp. PCC 7336 TaxID=195250 RepID=UPI00034C8CFB|nr:LysR family transcriptional regulator [Synechococcus sp. PCC 7336]